MREEIKRILDMQRLIHLSEHSVNVEAERKKHENNPQSALINQLISALYVPVTNERATRVYMGGGEA